MGQKYVYNIFIAKPAQVAAWWVKNKHIYIAKPTKLPPRRIKIQLFSFPNQDKYPHPRDGWVKNNQFVYWQTTMVTKWPLFSKKISNHSAVKREQIIFILMYQLGGQLNKQNN